MDENDFYLEELIQTKKAEEIVEIKKESEELFRESIYQKVYIEHPEGDSYSRTGQLLDSVESKIINDGELFLYNDTSNLSYTSWVDENNEVGAYVPSWMQNGHGGLATVEAREFLEEAKRVIDNKFNCDCEIINDEIDFEEI